MEMSSVQCLRRFVNERLSAAAEEIFGVFEKTVVVYEEEVVRQRRLLDILLKPEIKLHRTEYCTQERNSSVDQENPEPPKIKEEQELLSISLQGEQLGLKQETENFMLTPASVGSDRSQDQILFLDPGEHQCASGTQLPASICSSWLKNTRSEVPEPDHQLLSGNANETESQDHKKGNIRKKKSAKGARRTRATRCIKTSIAHKNTQSNKKPFKCNTPYACKVCGRYFRFRLNRDQHTRSHIGTKLCDTCGESFNN